MEPLLGQAPGVSPFAGGSLAEALFVFQTLRRACERLRPAAQKARALLGLAPLCQRLDRALGPADARGAGARGKALVEQLALTLPARAACASIAAEGAPGPRFLAALARRLAPGTADLGQDELLCWLAAAEGCPAPGAARRLGRAGPPHSAARVTGAGPLLQGRTEGETDLLPVTGVCILLGRSAALRCAGRLRAPEDARDYPASLSLLCALLAVGPCERGEARRVLYLLDGRARQEGLVRVALARSREGDADHARSLLRCVTHQSLRRWGRLAMVGDAARQGRLEEAARGVSNLASGRERALGSLAVAAAWSRFGDERGASEWLSRVDAELPLEALLLRAELDLAAGRLGSAEARLSELPKSALVPSRGPPPSASLLAGRPGLGAPLLATRVAVLRLELGLRRDGTIEAPWLAPVVWRDLIEHRSLVAALWTRLGPDDGRLERILAARGDADRNLLPSLVVTEGIARAARERMEALGPAQPAGRGEADPPADREEAYLLGARGDLATWERLRRDPRFASPVLLARALHDEGVSQSPGRDRHRVALLRAARQALRAALSGEAPEPEVTASRLRCVHNLGGPAAAGMLAASLEQAEPGRAASREVFSLLVSISPPLALRVFMRHHGRVTADGLHRAAMAGLLAGRSALEAAAPPKLEALASGLGARLGSGQAAAWLSDLLARWWERFGRPPSAAGLSLLLARLGAEDEPVPSPHDLLSALAHERTALLSRRADSLPLVLSRDLGARSLLFGLCPEAPLEGVRRWTEQDWTLTLRALGCDRSPVLEGMVQRLARRLRPGPGHRPLVEAWLSGRAPTAELGAEVALGSGLALRYLDKRRDFTLFLRFADCVTCCFNSASPLYRAGTAAGTQRWVLSLWKDPLSFCFQIVQRASSSEGTARGFVFGSVGLLDGAPAALLNGLYLKRQSAGLRGAVLGAIERALCRPLGLGAILVGNAHNGRGGLPPEFVAGRFRLRRLRALGDPSGEPQTRIYDDISSTVNLDGVPYSDARVKWLEPGAR